MLFQEMERLQQCFDDGRFSTVLDMLVNSTEADESLISQLQRQNNKAAASYMRVIVTFVVYLPVLDSPTCNLSGCEFT